MKRTPPTVIVLDGGARSYVDLSLGLVIDKLRHAARKRRRQVQLDGRDFKLATVRELAQADRRLSREELFPETPA